MKKNCYFFGLSVSFIVMLGSLIYGVATPRVLPNCFGIVFICLVAIYGFSFLAMNGDKEEKESMANNCLGAAVITAVVMFFCATAIRMIAVS